MAEEALGRVSIELEVQRLTADLTLPLRVRVQEVEAVLVSVAEYEALTGPVARRRGRLPLRQLRVTQWDQDTELAAFVFERLGRMTQNRILAEVTSRFGRNRTPTKSALNRFARRWKGEQSLSFKGGAGGSAR